MKSRAARLIGWLMPLICILGSAFYIFTLSNDLRSAQGLQSKAEKAVLNALAAKEEASKRPKQPKFAAVKRGDNEESDFLTSLKDVAERNGAVIASWNSSSSSYSSNKNDPSNDLTADIIRIDSSLALRGTYQGLRGFIESITSSERLYTLSNIAWTLNQDTNELNLNCTLSRYVEAPTLVTSTDGQKSS